MWWSTFLSIFSPTKWLIYMHFLRWENWNKECALLKFPDFSRTFGKILHFPWLSRPGNSHFCFPWLLQKFQEPCKCWSLYFFQKSLWLDAGGQKPNNTPLRSSTSTEGATQPWRSPNWTWSKAQVSNHLHHGSDMEWLSVLKKNRS